MNSSNKESRGITFTDKDGNINANNLDKEDNNSTENEPIAVMENIPEDEEDTIAKGQQELQETRNTEMI